MFFVSNTEINFELSPSLVRRRLAFPSFAVVVEYSSSKDTLVGDAENLRRRIRGLACSGKFHCVFDLLEKYFDGLVNIARLLHGQAILLEVARSDIGIVRVKVGQDFEGCASAKADVEKAEC